MREIYRAALVGCSRMGAFIDHEMPEGLHHRPLPYSHAAGYEACDRTDLVACSDIRQDIMAHAGSRYGIPTTRQYSDYTEMIEQERPDLLSVATQPEQRAEVVMYAAEQGVPAIYAEKALAASLDEADAIMQAVETAGIHFNMGTNRRWDRGYDAMKSVIDSGRLGRLKTLVSHQTGAMFNTASHIFDLLFRLNDDCPAISAQARLTGLEDMLDGNLLRNDPSGYGSFQFENGVMAHTLNTGRGLEIEAICEKGVVSALDNGAAWEMRVTESEDHRGRNLHRPESFPGFDAKSSTLCLIEDLVECLDTGCRPKGGIRTARQNTEMIFAYIQSHVAGGKHIDLPLSGSPYRLDRNPKARAPKYTRTGD